MITHQLLNPIKNLVRPIRSFFTPKKREKLDQQALILSMLEYFHYEISDLRSKTRHLLANDQISLPLLSQTYESFNYQWSKLNHGTNLIYDEIFRKNVTQQIVDYTGLNADWFDQKEVLDAGCGQGRFSYGFSLLKTSLTAVDQSSHAVAHTRKILNEISSAAIVKQANLLEPNTIQKNFDLVWSYGVLHHTGNTYQAFKNIVQLVKPEGYLFIMLYGEPQLNNAGSFQEQAEYSRLRHITRNMTYEQKVELLSKEKSEESLHGWFDAISPTINDTYSLEEIKVWLLSSGFKNIKVTSTSTNHHIIAQKKVIILSTNTLSQPEHLRHANTQVEILKNQSSLNKKSWKSLISLI